MKLRLFILFAFIFSLSLMGQNPIIYDLDSYKRVNFDYRTTTFSPDLYFEHNKTLNTIGQEKYITFIMGGDYRDYQLINSEKNQKSYFTSVDLNARTGTIKNFILSYRYDYDNRAYSGSSYFKNGFNVMSRTTYQKDLNPYKEFNQQLTLSYDIGFGFGRLEVVDNAWLGARILEELSKNAQLAKIPEADEMKDLFDVIGDLEFDRVLDNRLMTMNRLEKMIEYIEEKEFIDVGSVPAFVTIYDAFRYERFFNRLSGNRLEFSLNPLVRGFYSWNNSFLFDVNSNVQPGFEGSIGYESYKNGDLEYYSVKSIKGTIGYFERFDEGNDGSSTILNADLDFDYTYRYLPSLRTNFEISTSVTGRVTKIENYTSRLIISTRLAYQYYFSPATQLVLSTNIYYNDPAFQIGEYQPTIRSIFSIDVVHAIR